MCPLGLADSATAHCLDVSPKRTLLFGKMDGFSEDLLLVENVR